jgi:hypothetical protein
VKRSERARERKAQVLSLWHQRPDGKRTADDILAFYGEMERAFPHLLRRQNGDPYRDLINDLQGHMEAKKGEERVSTWADAMGIDWLLPNLKLPLQAMLSW